MSRQQAAVDMEDVYSEAEASEEPSESQDAVDALMEEEEAKQPNRKKQKVNMNGDGAFQPRPNRRQSEVWRFYDRKEDHTKVCKVCERHFSTNTATGALRKHLEKHFGEETAHVLTSAQNAVEVTISPATNTVTVSGLAPLAPASSSASTPKGKKLQAILPAVQQPILPAIAPKVLSSSTIVTGTAVPMKQRYKSSVWSFFFRRENGCPECATCQKVYSTTASTSGLQRHIDGHQKNGTPIVKVDLASYAVKVAGPHLTTSPAFAVKSTSSKNNFASINGEEILLKLAVQEYLPLEEIANQFSAVYRLNAGKTVEVPTLEGKLRQWFTAKQDEIRKIIREVTSKISLSVELWVSECGQTFLIISAHFMSDSKWEPMRFVLDCIIVSPNVTAETIKVLLETVVNNFDIAGKLIAITTGDAEVMEAFKQLNLLVSVKPIVEIAHVKCIGWALKECVQPTLEILQEPVQKVRLFLQMVLNHRHASELQTLCGLLLQDYYELTLDSHFLWSSTVTMLEAAVKMQPVIDDFVKRHADLYAEFSEEEWQKVQLTVELLTNFHLAVQDVCKSDFPTLSNVLPLIEYLTFGLAQQKDSETAPSWWKEEASNMLERTQTELQALCSDVYFFGTVLDPRHKLSTIPASVNREEIEANLRKVFSRYLLPTTTPSEASLSVHAGSSGFKAGSLMSVILKKNRDSMTQPAQIDELNQYLNTAVEQPDVDPLEWWNNHRKVYPNLALMARDYLCIPATSVASDHLFFKERRMGRLRNRLNEEDLLTYVCLNSWISVSDGPKSSGVTSTVTAVKKEV